MMSDQERIAALEKEIEFLKGKISVLENMAGQRWVPYPVSVPEVPKPIYPWNPPYWYTTGDCTSRS